MAIIFIDGFDILGADNEAVASVLTAGEYIAAVGAKVTSTLVRTVTTGLPSMALSMDPLNAPTVQYRAPSDSSTLITGFGLYKTNAALEVADIFDFEHNTGAAIHTQITLRRDTNNSFVLINAVGSTLGTSVINEFQFNTWMFVEIKAHAGVTDGTATVRVNEKEVISVTSAMTVGSTNATVAYNQVKFLQNGGAAGQPGYFDDYYIADTSGAVNNDFLGQISCYTLPVNADGSTNGWAVGAGATNRWSAVSEYPKHDGDTSYITASTVGNTQFFHVAELPDTVTDVFAVKNVMMGRKEASGSNSLQLPIRQGGTTASGVTQTIDTTYGFDGQMFETAPGGGGLTPTVVSSMQIGVTIVSTA